MTDEQAIIKLGLKTGASKFCPIKRQFGSYSSPRLDPMSL